MWCNNSDALILSAYGELKDQEFKQHLVECPTCQLELEQTHEIRYIYRQTRYQKVINFQRPRRTYLQILPLVACLLFSFFSLLLIRTPEPPKPASTTVKIEPLDGEILYLDYELTKLEKDEVINPLDYEILRLQIKLATLENF